MKKFAVFAVAAAVAGAAYAASPPMPSIASTSDLPAWAASQEAYLNWNRAQPGWSISKTGIQSHRLSPAGKGARPTPTDQVTIRYEGKLINGKVFDSSARAGGPVTYPLPALIKGWQEVIPTMRRGETWEFLIPAAMAYRDRTDRAQIPPNSALIFEIELFDFKPAE